MMKKIFLFTVALTALLAASCDQSEKLDITLKQDNSGEVSVTLHDDSDLPLKNVELELSYRTYRGSSYSYYYDAIMEGETDDEG
ncbi:MAG: hypothetical protein MI922_17645, partial [Bacteroidales bacterium]|nr:hypothetical protein [Bacteroidales bacterium]